MADSVADECDGIGVAFSDFLKEHIAPTLRSVRDLKAKVMTYEAQAKASEAQAKTFAAQVAALEDEVSRLELERQERDARDAERDARDAERDARDAEVQKKFVILKGQLEESERQNAELRARGDQYLAEENRVRPTLLLLFDGIADLFSAGLPSETQRDRPDYWAILVWAHRGGVYCTSSAASCRQGGIISRAAAQGYARAWRWGRAATGSGRQGPERIGRSIPAACSISTARPRPSSLLRPDAAQGRARAQRCDRAVTGPGRKQPDDIGIRRSISTASFERKCSVKYGAAQRKIVLWRCCCRAAAPVDARSQRRIRFTR